MLILNSISALLKNCLKVPFQVSLHINLKFKFRFVISSTILVEVSRPGEDWTTLGCHTVPHDCANPRPRWIYSSHRLRAYVCRSPRSASLLWQLGIKGWPGAVAPGPVSCALLAPGPGIFPTTDLVFRHGGSTALLVRAMQHNCIELNACCSY